MPNGFTSPGSFNQNRKASASYGTPYANTPYYNIVYKTQASQAATAFALLQNGNSSSKRIKNWNYVTFSLKKQICEGRAFY
jgi:hypothetical protein